MGVLIEGRMFFCLSPFRRVKGSQATPQWDAELGLATLDLRDVIIKTQGFKKSEKNRVSGSTTMESILNEQVR